MKFLEGWLVWLATKETDFVGDLVSRCGSRTFNKTIFTIAEKKQLTDFTGLAAALAEDCDLFNRCQLCADCC